MSLAEIAKKTGHHRATVYRILQTLAGAGYLSVSPTEPTYSIGPRLLGYLRGPALDAALHHRTLPLLKELAEASGETVALFLPSWPDLICAACVLSDHPIRRHHDVGDVAAMTQAAPGRAYLAFAPSGHVESALSLRPLTPATAHSVATEAEFRKRLNEARADGYAFSEAETNEGMSGLSAPVFSGASELPVAVVSISGPTFRWGVKRIREFAPTLLAAISKYQKQFDSVQPARPGN
jgi:DNA-binding IclR family transcriptional regulator